MIYYEAQLLETFCSGKIAWECKSERGLTTSAGAVPEKTVSYEWYDAFFQERSY